ncbi:diadenylate cyclase CdaA [Syntrophomonas zehnderi]|uniref:diadenylate cyclase CdaA n=1 Tax=Syntrophomonas zehnderi TaxID=404335 RepID=UPI000625C82A
MSLLSGVFASPWDIFRNLLDIFIVAYVIYRLLGLIQGTRAVQLLKGLMILLVFSVAASYMQLDMLNWLLEKLWIFFAIALPIVFQPELRRLLEQLGKGSFFKSSSTDVDPQDYQVIIKEITDAVGILSRNRVGALIVIARETGIEEYLESGITVDSLVSSGLLINTFVPNTPLHDGALVIRDGRIYKAACVLPLSNDPQLPPQLGTRHRAGLGITEVSDALAIIVSEETGSVSLGRDRKLIRYLDAQSLRELLEKELINDDVKPTLWRRWSRG